MLSLRAGNTTSCAPAPVARTIPFRSSLKLSEFMIGLRIALRRAAPELVVVVIALALRWRHIDARLFTSDGADDTRAAKASPGLPLPPKRKPRPEAVNQSAFEPLANARASVSASASTLSFRAARREGAVLPIISQLPG